ncbi:pteridine reductase [Methylomarinum sp. Ch1-1]|uniref:Pteridine reductase n=1 Tax=Methylomarinum roseum TaxID=3067653 RepID=A0AAU7NY11_9GAMM
MVKNVLITGAARRIGATCARLLHAEGYNICLHYRSSERQAEFLCGELNRQRAGSAITIQADLLEMQEVKRLAETAEQAWQGIDVLVNNASSFYSGAVDEATEQDWEVLLGSNLKAPFFLAQALLPSLRAKRGCIVNIIDIHAERGLKSYPLYSISKGGLATLTRSLAKELGPDVRVNGVAPGAILWPEHEITEQTKADILQRVALQRCGDPLDIARAVRFLIDEADYITGQIIAVDGGRTLFC